MRRYFPAELVNEIILSLDMSKQNMIYLMICSDDMKISDPTKLPVPDSILDFILDMDDADKSIFIFNMPISEQIEGKYKNIINISKSLKYYIFEENVSCETGDEKEDADKDTDKKDTDKKDIKNKTKNTVDIKRHLDMINQFALEFGWVFIFDDFRKNNMRGKLSKLYSDLNVNHIIYDNITNCKIITTKYKNKTCIFNIHAFLKLCENPDVSVVEILHDACKVTAEIRKVIRPHVGVLIENYDKCVLPVLYNIMLIANSVSIQDITETKYKNFAVTNRRYGMNIELKRELDSIWEGGFNDYLGYVYMVVVEKATDELNRILAFLDKKPNTTIVQTLINTLNYDLWHGKFNSMISEYIK